MDTVDPKSHTPLNFPKLQNKYNTKGSSVMSKLPFSKKDFPNILLVAAVCAFIFSFGYSINVNNLITSNPRASTPITPPVDEKFQVEYVPTAFDQIKDYPKMYDNTAIPDELYSQGRELYKANTDLSDLKKYIIKQVAKYYIFNDVLGTKIPNGLTFQEIEASIPDLEAKVKQTELTRMDFAFIQARIAGPTDAYSEERKKRFSNPESKATELINKYRVKLAENPNLAEFIVKESNSDEEMTFINAQESNEIKNDFMIDSPLYLTDKGFNTFLFSQKANAVSSPYAVKGANGEVFAYVIVMPIKITQGKFQSFDDLYKQKITLFMF